MSKSKSKSPFSVSLYSMFDASTDSYGPLIEAPTDQAAFRSVSHFIALNPDSPVALWPHDYKIYRLGTFDKSSGLISNNHEYLCTAGSLPRLALVSDNGAEQPQELSAEPLSEKPQASLSVAQSDILDHIARSRSR